MPVCFNEMWQEKEPGQWGSGASQESPRLLRHRLLTSLPACLLSLQPVMSYSPALIYKTSIYSLPSHFTPFIFQKEERRARRDSLSPVEDVGAQMCTDRIIISWSLK